MVCLRPLLSDAKFSGVNLATKLAYTEQLANAPTQEMQKR